VELNFAELRDLLTLLNQTDLAELILKSSEFELTLRKGQLVSGDRPSFPGNENASAPLMTQASPPVAAPPASLPAAIPSAPPPTVSNTDRLVNVTSPMVGTFYRAPAPDEPPFVDVGDRIRTGQTVCIVEAMKLMNELEAEVSGEVVEILLQNGDPVEYGQVLMRVNPG
jgi:acetyl-CoA carboxylase biotin carboxyl carrier protein